MAAGQRFDLDWVSHDLAALRGAKKDFAEVQSRIGDLVDKLIELKDKSTQSWPDCEPVMRDSSQLVSALTTALNALMKSRQDFMNAIKPISPTQEQAKTLIAQFLAAPQNTVDTATSILQRERTAGKDFLLRVESATATELASRKRDLYSAIDRAVTLVSAFKAPTSGFGVWRYFFG
ncbi:MAG: hypothetical protein ABF544_08160 [Acetobacter orientalis]|uniref:hypothetical protein n=1 Tax=Acetobacter orientalis TaxID=146474 RepID=UPI0039EA8787